MKRQIHQSGLSLAAKCGVAYYLRYEEGLKLPPRAYQATGTGVDRSVRTNLAAKIQHGELLPLDHVADIARDNAVVALDGFEADSRDLEEYGTAAATRAAAIDRTVRLARLHAEKVAPLLEPADVAVNFALDVDGYDFQYVGEIDVREVGAGGERRIRDTKTKRKSPPQTEAQRSMQLTGYALAEYSQAGALPDSLHLDVLVDLKRDGPVLRGQQTKRTAADVPMFLDRLQQLHQLVEIGRLAPAIGLLNGPGAVPLSYTPADVSHWVCSQDYCGYFHRCPYASRPRSVVIPESRNVAELAPLAERAQRTREADDE